MQYKSTSLDIHTFSSTIHHPLSSPQTPLEYKEVLPLKIAFTNWIKTLPMEERFVAVKIYAPGLSHAIRSLFWQRPFSSLDRNFSYQTPRPESNQQMSICQPRKPVSKLQKHLFQYLVFLSDGYDFLDNLCFDFSLLECPERLFDMLTCNVKHQQVRLMEEALHSKRNSGNMQKNISELKVKELIMEQLFNFMRNSLLEPHRIPNLLEEQRQRKKDFSIFWRNISTQHRQDLLLLQCKDIKGLLTYLQKQGISISQPDMQRQIEELLKLEKNEFCNKIFKCKLKKSMNPLFDYYELVYLIWKKDVDRNKRKKQGKSRRDRDYNSQQKSEQKEVKAYKKRQKNKKSTSVESNQTNQTEHQTIFGQNSHSNGSLQKRQTMLDKIKCEKIMERNQDALVNQQNEDIDVKSEKVSQVETKDYIKVQQASKMMKRQKQEYFKCQTPQKHSIQNKSSQNQIQISSQTASLCKQVTKQQITKFNLEKLELQLQQISDQISEQANYYHQRRIVAFQRIQFLLNYYSIPIKLFGSCANGIAVKNSDIDIAIDQHILSSVQYLPEGQKVRVALQNLQSLLSNYPTFKEIKVIKTAAIPVMKVTIDTSIPFLCPQYGESYIILNRSHNCGPIQADITIQTPNKQNQSSHLGIRTTNAISQWLTSIKSLRSIVIVMKSFLTLNRLNLSYEGGLNTFAMIVMLVAYIRQMKLQDEQNSALILQKVLHFYAQQFKEKEYGIDLLNENKKGIYFKKECVNGSPSKIMKADLQIIDPICCPKNMTRNCYLYPQLKKLFKTMLTACFSRAQVELVELSHKALGQQELNEMNNKCLAQRNVFRQLQNSFSANF